MSIMKIKIHLDPKTESVFIQCPFCSYIHSCYSAGPILLDECFTVDYCTRPEFNCQQCGARSFFRTTETGMYKLIKKFFSKSEAEYLNLLKNLKISKVRDLPDVYKKQKKIKVITLELDLFFIDKIINYKLFKYETDNDIGEKKVRKFIESGYSKKYAKKYGIRKMIPPREYLPADIANFNLSVTCNSYNFAEPSEKYPENFSVRTKTIVCLCRNKKLATGWSY